MYKCIGKDRFKLYEAGRNVVLRWGKKAQELVESYKVPNENGFYSIPVDGRAYWTIGTSNGKYGEFAKVDDGFLSVNSAGYAWAKVETAKEAIFLNMIDKMLKCMNAEKVDLPYEEDGGYLF